MPNFFETFVMYWRISTELVYFIYFEEFMNKSLTILIVALFIGFTIRETNAALLTMTSNDIQTSLDMLTAQEPETPEEEEEDDEFKWEDEDDWDDVEDLEELDGYVFLKEILSNESKFEWEKSAPTIEFQYGLATPRLDEKGWNGDFAQLGTATTRFGYSTVANSDNSTQVAEYSFYFLDFHTTLEDLYKEVNDATKTRAESWRIGIGSQGGYGWRIAEKGLLTLYTGSTMNWGKHDFIDQQTLDAPNNIATKVFQTDVHYGQSMSSGIKARIGRYVNVTAEYEMQTTFPRFQFWKWTLSGLCHRATNLMVSIFTNDIEERTPMVVPVINFVLQSAINYGYYELTKNDVNWPANTAPPLQQEAFKVGMSFSF